MVSGIARILRSVTQLESVNFAITNRIPRQLATRFMGWYSRIESPALTRLSIAVWQVFGGSLNLEESRQKEFRSLQECFTRELKPGARTIDQRDEVVISPCDAIVGAFGRINGTVVMQIKGSAYKLEDLIPDVTSHYRFRNGWYVTLRLRSNMYHRFHAPVDCEVRQITYISGDVWNVNPIALRRVEKLFCKNERAVVELNLAREDRSITMVPVASVLVASLKFNCLREELNLAYRGPNRVPCFKRYRKGEEMGYFQQGSTILLFATANYVPCEGIHTGNHIKVGEPLMRESAGI